MNCSRLATLALRLGIVAILLAVPWRLHAEHQGKSRILLLGDSTTIGSVCRITNPEGPHLEDIIRELLASETDLPSAEIINQGRDGEFIEGLLASGRYDHEIAMLPDIDYILIRYGINDFYKSSDFDTDFVKYIRKLIARLRNNFPKAEIILMTVIPYITPEVDERINRLIRQVAKDEQLPFFDLYSRYKTELVHGENMLNYRRYPLEKIPSTQRKWVQPYVRDDWVVVMDNLLDAHFRGLPGWFADRHPNLAGYHVIGDETAKLLAPRIRARSYSGRSVLLEQPITPEELADLNKFSLRKVRGIMSGGAVLDLGLAEKFDALWVSCPSVLFAGEVYRMWYSSVYDSQMGLGGIGLTASSDGINWNRMNDGQSVLTVGQKGEFDDGQVMGPMVISDGHTFRMWYTGMASKWHGSGHGFYRIGLATSKDGIHWKRENEGKPVLDIGPPGSYDEVQVATPSILYEDGNYRMWYAAWSPATGHTICVARSTDGIHWERENGGKPVEGLKPMQGFGPAVCHVNDHYLLLYMALQAGRSLYGATSSDGIHWTMLNGSKSLLPLGGPPDFDSDYIGHPFLLSFANHIRVWYTGYRREEGGIRGWKLRIGMAEVER